MSLTVSGTKMTQFLFGFSTVVCFLFCIFFYYGHGSAGFKLHRPAESKEKYIPIPSNPVQTLVLLKRQKLACSLLSASYFSPESRDTSLHSCYFAFICVLWTEGTWRGWDEKDVFLPTLSLCTMLLCRNSHAALRRDKTQLFFFLRDCGNRERPSRLVGQDYRLQ